MSKELTLEEFKHWLDNVVLHAFDAHEKAASVEGAPSGRFPRIRKLPREVWCERLRSFLEPQKAEELTALRAEEQREAHDRIMAWLGRDGDDEDELRP